MSATRMARKPFAAIPTQSLRAGAGRRFSVLAAPAEPRSHGECFWNESGMILKAVRALMMIKALICTFSVAGAGFEPATSGL